MRAGKAESCRERQRRRIELKRSATELLSYDTAKKSGVVRR